MPTTPDYDAPTALKLLLEAEGLAMSKRLGQNFLVNRNARERILAAALGLAGLSPQPQAETRIWEIGPGIGSMTELALDAGFQVAAFELDHGFARLLGRIFGERPNFRLVEGDFLKTWRAELEASGPPALVFGNLPYNVANAIVAVMIEGFAEAGLPTPPMAFTVQKEAAIRMASKPGTKDYSAFSVLCTSACKVTPAFDLSASSFWPVPRVTSTLVVMKPKPRPIGGADRKAFSTFCRSAFATRRKTLKNNLKAAGWPEQIIEPCLVALGHSPSIRAEVLRPEEFETLLAGLQKARAALGPGEGPGPT